MSGAYLTLLTLGLDWADRLVGAALFFGLPLSAVLLALRSNRIVCFRWWVVAAPLWLPLLLAFLLLGIVCLFPESL